MSASHARTMLVGGLLAAASLATTPALAARTVEDCQLKWGQAARSYATQTNPPSPDDGSFKAACELEAKGDKPAARVEAIAIALAALAKQSQDACERFGKYYVGFGDPAAICSGASDADALKKAVGEALKK